MNDCHAKPSWQRNTGNYNAAADPRALIYNEGQWKVYKVSPLFRFQYETIRLKQYGSKIRQTIASEVSASSSLKYTVTVTPEPHLKYTEDDPHGLYITVTHLQELPNKQPSKVKVAYKAILLSWGVNNKIGDDTVHLPYMLERGEQKIGAAVKKSLQILFDCNIKQFLFSQVQLLAVGLKFLDFDTSRESDQFVLEYKCTDVDIKNKVKFSFDIGDMRIIWNGIKEEATQPLELLRLAYHVIQNQIFHMIAANITSFELTAVLMPKGEVKSNGTVKMMTAELVNFVLSMFNDICASNSFEELNVTPPEEIR